MLKSALTYFLSSLSKGQMFGPSLNIQKSPHSIKDVSVSSATLHMLQVPTMAKELVWL